MTKYHSDTEQLKRRNYELAILNTIADALSREVDLNAALQTALSKVTELLGLRTGWIWLMEDESESFYLAAAQNLPPILSNEQHRMEGSCYCLDSFRDGDLGGAANVNVIKCSRLWGLSDGTEGLQYHSSIPLYGSRSRQLGVLNVADTDWVELSNEDLRLLYTIGDLISITIERARLFRQSAELGAAEERNRLAREIHDTLAQSLAAIAMQLETAEALIEIAADEAKIKGVIGNALTLSRSTLDEARRSVMDLRAGPLEGQSLAAALRGLTDELAHQLHVEAAFEVEGEERSLTIRQETGLFRIAQEALANVRKHAQAAEVHLRLAFTAAEVELVIEDDGRGFETDAIPPGRYGLMGMSERARLLDGQISFESNPGSGTRITVKIPLE